ncbi:hypothetical protein PIB30_109107, partial [Stylosanthes scabra]|nr:hypothetical protein [Stylosanthes scabra]
MAVRVSTWKQRIENSLEEMDSHPPFDIQEYGARILDKLSLEESSSCVRSFSDLVAGQTKFDVARSFSSLLQLVNNRDVDLERNGNNGESMCYSAINPFHVRLLKNDKERGAMQFHLSRKRPKSATKRPAKDRDGRGKSPTI